MVQLCDDKEVKEPENPLSLILERSCPWEDPPPTGAGGTQGTAEGLLQPPAQAVVSFPSGGFYQGAIVSIRATDAYRGKCFSCHSPSRRGSGRFGKNWR